MSPRMFTASDRRQMQDLGITESQVLAQLHLLRQPPPPIRLVRPCTLGDGIREISGAERESLIHAQEEAARQGRLQKFVPASGVASRMFQSLFEFYHHSPGDLEAELPVVREGEAGTFRDCCLFLENLGQFAFYQELEATLARNGLDLEALVAQRRGRQILHYFLTGAGLHYGFRPKGLVKFHAYPAGARTPFEEHLVEAVHLVRDGAGCCRLHFTVSPEHAGAFQELWDSLRPLYEEQYGTRFDVGFSQQRPSTSTIAVDLEGRPFRLADGCLLFRPGGHGALLGNLHELQGDLVYIKNIDNVAPDRLREPSIVWQKILAGYLVRIQKKIADYLTQLHTARADRQLLGEVKDFARHYLLLDLPADLDRGSPRDQGEFLFQALHRPVRVCGMVRNQGEPGGGPFWVRDRGGRLSLQIVESAQVDAASPEQRAIWEAASHFNPVMLVCGVRDFQGQPFNLQEFVDPEAVFISRKSQEGRELLALELPGLWNGAMARWLTLFVEVPLITFNPVKTVFDLLRPGHRSE
ncbi:MAG: DUF4301 family protein [Thermodesulfobacteriota bacterium]